MQTIGNCLSMVVRIGRYIYITSIVHYIMESSEWVGEIYQNDWNVCICLYVFGLVILKEISAKCVESK